MVMMTMRGGAGRVAVLGSTFSTPSAGTSGSLFSKRPMDLAGHGQRARKIFTFGMI